MNKKFKVIICFFIFQMLFINVVNGAIIEQSKVLDFFEQVFGVSQKSDTQVDDAIPNNTKPVIRLEYDKEHIRVVLPVSVIIEGGATLKDVKYSAGIQSAEYFKTFGQSIINNMEFMALENSAYTVYVIDVQGNEDIKTVYINNVDNFVLNTVIDYSTEPIYSDVLNINVSVLEGQVQELKWLKGNKQLEDFAQGGNDFTNEKKFFVYENGQYTLFVKDGNGNAEIKVINVNNLYMKNPIINVNVIRSLPLQDWSYKAIVKVNNLNSAVLEDTSFKWLKGVKVESDFENGGNVVVNGQFEITERITEETYFTLYAKDRLGQVAVVTFTVDKVDVDLPYVAYMSDTGLAKFNGNEGLDLTGIYIVDDDSGIKSVSLNSANGVLKDYVVNQDGTVFIPINDIQKDVLYQLVMEDNVGFVVNAEIKISE